MATAGVKGLTVAHVIPLTYLVFQEFFWSFKCSQTVALTSLFLCRCKQQTCCIVQIWQCLF